MLAHRSVLPEDYDAELAAAYQFPWKLASQHIKPGLSTWRFEATLDRFTQRSETNANLAALKSRSTTYSITDTFIGQEFYTGFNWEVEPDPTDGFVNYISQADAVAAGLLNYTSTTLYMAADSTTLNPPSPGRNSQRARSNNAYGVAVIVLDLAHAPAGCGTWPAFWTVDEADWPNEGEIDIIEYVNDVGPNAETLHTSANCTQPASGP